MSLVPRVVESASKLWDDEDIAENANNADSQQDHTITPKLFLKWLSTLHGLNSINTSCFPTLPLKHSEDEGLSRHQECHLQDNENNSEPHL